MEQELSTEPQYRQLETFSKKDLQVMADKLDLKLPPSMGVPKMAQAIRVRQTRLPLDAEREAKEQMRAETSGDRKPTFEEVLVNGGEFRGKHYDPSPRNIYEFRNELDPGEPVAFTKGGMFFRIFEKDKKGAPLLCVMPECFCEKVPPPRKGAERLELMEYELLKAVSLVQAGVPIYDNVRDSETGATMSKIVGYKPRFSFHKVGPAPEGAQFGLYLEEPKE